MLKKLSFDMDARPEVYIVGAMGNITQISCMAN